MILILDQSRFSRKFFRDWRLRWRPTAWVRVKSANKNKMIQNRADAAQGAYFILSSLRPMV